MDLSELTKPRKAKVERRSRAAMKAMRERIHQLSSQGMSRKAISLEIGCTPAQVTQTLGAVRSYRGLRFHMER
jgi:DNA-binding CsgD family transcriptional regulator